MVSQAKGGCSECGSITHTKMHHKPKKPLKRIAINNKRREEFISGVKKLNDMRLPPLELVLNKPRKKKTPRASAKTKAWDAFSLYIRTRDCIRFTGDPEQGMCVTCKNPFPRTKLQAGHFVAGRGNAVLFNEQIVYSQCGYCNQKPPMGLGGNYAAYTLFMFDEGYSREEIEGFLALKGTTKQYKLHDFIEIEKEYKQKLLDLTIST